MKGAELSNPAKRNSGETQLKSTKPPFRPAKDDTKPHLQDPILRSDPIESEEAVFRIPSFLHPISDSHPKLG